MITATVWVPRGYAATFPTKYDVDENELARISKLAKLKLEDAKHDLNDAKNGRNGETATEDYTEDEDNGVKIPKTNAYASDSRTAC